MKKTLLALLMALLLALPSVAAPPQEPFKKPATPSGVASIDNTTFIDANNILMFVTNHGNFCRDLSDYFGYDAGTFYPYNTVADIESGLMDNLCLYASGLWVGATVDGGVRVTIAEYSDEYVPGPMQDGSFLPDDPTFKVYKLYKDSLADNPNDDYTNWPVAHGAPVDDQGNPKMIGDQMLWAVYNDADPVQHDNASGDTDPLDIEVQQTTFAWDREDPLGNIIFIKLQIFNKGSNLLEDCYFSLWSDPDLGGSGDDLVGCDTTLSVGFVYNATNADQQYGSAPPSVGYDFFQGPLHSTGSDADTAKMWDTIWAGYRNMGMVSFDKYINGTDPDNAQESYNYMRGLNRDGSPYTYNGIPTKYFFSGDPVKGTGDLDDTPADRRFMLSTGPVTFAPGDSTEILAAIIVGDGIDRKSSISVMKYYDKFAQATYENDFEVLEAPAVPVVTVAEDDNRITLSWTTISQENPGSYPFEGYAVWQGESPSGPWTQVINFDVVNTVEDILDEVFDPITGALESRLVKDGSNQGVLHDIVIDEDYILGGRLNNATAYYYKVEAYSYFEAGTPKTQTSKAIVTATPQSPLAGTELGYNFADTIQVTHVGISDGFVLPFTIDSYLFDNHTYQVSFTDTTDLHIEYIFDPAYPGDTDEATIINYNIGWHLIDITDGDTILSWQWDQSGDTTFELIEGVLFNQSGPPLELNYYTWTGETRSLTAVDWGGSSFFGGVGLLGEFFGSTLLASDLVDIEFRWVEDGTGQYAYCYRRDKGYGYEGFFQQDITVWDVSATPERQINFAFVESYDPTENDGQDADSVWNPGEQVNIDASSNSLGGREYFFIMKSDYSATEIANYAVDGACFNDNDDFDCLYAGWLTARGGTSGKPTPGDTWLYVPNYVNTVSDTFYFTVTDPTYTTTESDLDRINVVPNPFYLYGTYDPAPGNYQLKFQHLPDNCTITIYNLGGDLIRTIEKNDPSTSIATWDTRTENGLPVASGIYIYVVEAPGFGTKIGKMAIFTEVEVLKVY